MVRVNVLKLSSDWLATVRNILHIYTFLIFGITKNAEPEQNLYVPNINYIYY